MNVVDVLSGTLIVAGCLLGLLGGVGVLRLPDVFGRMHAATKPATPAPMTWPVAMPLTRDRQWLAAGA